MSGRCQASVVLLVLLYACAPQVVTYGNGASPQESGEPLGPEKLRGSPQGETEADERVTESLRRAREFQTQKPPSEIIVTAGPLNQAYEPLGPVHADSVGVVNVGSILVDSLFRSPVAAAMHATPKANVPQMNEWLRNAAVMRYGSVDAIINVTYQNQPDGDAFADGLAVRFITQQTVQPPPATKTMEERLERLKALLDRGLIDRDEYDRKRTEILKEL